MAASHVLLYPDDVSGECPSLEDGPRYGSVDATSSDESVTITLSDGASVTVPPNVASDRSVPPAELNGLGAGEFLRRPVMVRTGNAIVYGQGIAYDGDQLVVQVAGTTSRTIIAPVTAVEEVAPVICALLHRAHLDVDTYDAAAVDTIHTTILNRLLGTRNVRASRKINTLLEGLVDADARPTEDATIVWMSPISAVAVSVRVQHVVDFGFYHDGHRRVPRTVRIGSKFWNDPASGQPDPPSSPVPAEPTAHDPIGGHPDDSRLDQWLQSLSPEVSSNEEDDASILSAPPTKKPRHDAPTDTLDAKIVAALANHPDLLRYYVSRLAGPASTPASGALASTPNQTSLDHLATEGRHAFQPSALQCQVHQLLVSNEHKGKSPVDFIEYCMSSRATKFQPHPATLCRIYDFQFGVRGLSVLHFRRFDLAARRRWRREAVVNMADFSPKVDLPKIAENIAFGEMADALAVLGVFAEEFFDTHTRKLICDAREFCEELKSFSSWSSDDVRSIAYWYDSVFEEYRRRAVDDISSGGTSRTLARSRLTIQDNELHGLLYALHSEKFASYSTPHGPPSRGNRPPQSNKYGPNQVQSRGVPEEVLDQVPRVGNRSICLKFLSVSGCRFGDRCSRPHVQDAHIPPSVVRYVNEKLGGLRPSTQ